MALLNSIQPSAVPVRINFDFFFDKAGVASEISKIKRAGLYRSGSVVMQIARRSIKKMGMAAPKLKVQEQYAGASLGQLLTFGDNMVSKRQKNQIRKRLFEIRFRPPSPAGTPPHTHLGTLRNAITYAYDKSRESVVVGGFMPGIPRIVSLHEFGGIQKMQAWAWIPRNNGRGYTGIIGWWAVGREPYRRRDRWYMLGSQMGEDRRGGSVGGRWTKNFRYPARPYMNPALMEGIRRGRIPKAFGSNVRMTGSPG